MSSSKTKYEIAAPIAFDLEWIAHNLRDADRREVWAASHSLPDQAVGRSVEVSRDTARVGRADGEPVCLFGVAAETVLSRVGSPWLLGTDAVQMHARAFLRLNRAYMKELRRDYDFLANYVDLRNTQAIRWLEWLGFTMLDPEPYGIDQMPFHPFFLGDPNV